MEGVKLMVSDIGKVVWPARCPACAAQLNEGEGKPHDIYVNKKRKAKSAQGTPKSIPAKFCSRCTSRRSFAKNVSYLGGALVLIAFVGAMIRWPSNTTEWTGAGVVFWLGVIICWWADSREKSTVGVEIDRVAENEWDFRFNNGEYAGAFFETNQGPLDPVEVHNANAIEYQSKGKFNEAINEYREALRINPDASEVRGNLGLAYYGRGNTDDAIREWKEALRIDPGCLTAQYNLGVTYRDQGRMEEALACFQEFVRRATPEWDEFAKQVKKDIRKIERIIRSD